MILLFLLFFFSSSFCQLIPTSLSGLELSLIFCGNLSCVLWDKLRYLWIPLVALTTLKSHFHFLFIIFYFSVDHELLGCKAWGLLTIYSPVLSKCQGCQQLFVKGIHEYLLSARGFLFCKGKQNAASSSITEFSRSVIFLTPTFFFKLPNGESLLYLGIKTWTLHTPQLSVYSQAIEKLHNPRKSQLCLK